MKTITEFSSITLRLANEKLQEILRQQPPEESKPAEAKAEAPVVEASVPEAPQSLAGETTGTDSEPTVSAEAAAEPPATAAAEPAAEVLASTVESAAPTPIEGTVPSEPPASGTGEAEITPPKPPKIVIKSKPTAATLNEAGKKALGAEMKLDDAKVELLLQALTLARNSRAGLKRVLVFTLGEKESVPTGATKLGEHHFLAEQIPGMPEKPRRDERGHGRGGSGGGKGKHGDKGRGGGRDSGRRGEKSTGEPGRGGGERHPAPRGSRAPRPIVVTKVGGPLPVIVPKPRT